MKLTRRDLMKLGLGATALAAAPRLFSAAAPAAAPAAPATSNLPLITKVIPSTGERIPVIGIGTRTYATVTDGIREVLKGLGESGCTMVDTAAGYGNSENVIGEITQGLGNRGKLFLATKVGNGGKAEIDASFTRLRTDKIDLNYVWNLSNTDANLGVLREYKAAGKIKYIGVTTSNDNQYGQLEQLMRTQALDFVQLDYAMNNRNVEERLLPLAIERRIAIVTNLPLGRTSLLTAVAGKPLPPWAAEIDVTTWPQFFLKYNVSHPAVTAAIPGTTRPEHLVDNVQAARGRLPDAAMRTRMEQYFATL